MACGPSAQPGPFRAGLQSNGSIGLAGNGAVAAMKPQLEISAPILPDMLVWQYKGGAGYPASVSAAQQLVQNSTYTYEWLLMGCKQKYPTISFGAGLTTAQLAINYDQVSRCAYADYGAKPYWMPQILDDVAVCEVKLGSDWRLLSEQDLAGLSGDDYKFIEETMSIAKGTDWFPRQFYFSLDAYVRGTDGTLKAGNLAPGATHVGPLPIAMSQWKELYTGNGRPIGVRCARSTPVKR